MRPLPAPSNRPLNAAATKFVDAAQGNDANSGDEAHPWKTLTHAAGKLQPGDTLCLRGGVYWEHAVLSCQGTSQKPITVRSYPGELATINGGIREFTESPATAWEPCPEGVAGEYRSTKAYQFTNTSIGGNFADSMVPLMGYQFLVDLRDPSMNWDVESKVDGSEGVYCGPGVYFAPETGRIHARLAHTTLKAIGDENYRGETDPRKMPLIIGGLTAEPALLVRNSDYVVLQDLVVCGARSSGFQLDQCSNMTVDGCTIYGANTAMNVKGTNRLRMVDTAIRGIQAPWGGRSHLKYRSVEARLFSGDRWTVTGRENQDFEIAYCEFTDSVDGIFIGNLRHVHFHHNLVDNISDDGIFLTATTTYDGSTHGGDHYLYQNLMSRCLTQFAFGVGHGRQKMTERGRQTGEGEWIFRNVFDFRGPVPYGSPKEDQEITARGRMMGDHGSPNWEPMTIYQNTIVEELPMSTQYYLAHCAAGTGGGNKRRLFNNIAARWDGAPGKELPVLVKPEPKPVAKKPAKKLADDAIGDLLDGAAKPSKSNITAELSPGDAKALSESTERKPLPAPKIDFQADGNLSWSYTKPPKGAELLTAFRNSPTFAASQTEYPPGWTTHDVVADPQFVAFDGNWRQSIDLRLKPSSPAVKAGVELPKSWPDPLRPAGSPPDVGAIPLGAAPWRVGVRGRMTAFGEVSSAKEPPQFEPIQFPNRQPKPELAAGLKAAIVEGYPAFDAPFIRYATVKHGGILTNFERKWLDASEYKKFNLVVIVGDLARAKMEPHQYTSADITHVRSFLQQGGTLLLMPGGLQAFGSRDGQNALYEFIGSAPPRKNVEVGLRSASHPWLKHLDAKLPHPWINNEFDRPLAFSQGEAIIGSDDSRHASLLRAPVGKGQLIYIGWDLNRSYHTEDEASTPDDERIFEEQEQLLEQIVLDAAAKGRS